jgi:hypothetical protein
VGAYVARPFEGLPSECDLVALRELVPSATAPLTIAGTDHAVTLCTLLPMAAPAMLREGGEVWLGLQVQHQFGDPSRDLAAVLTQALALAGEGAEPGIVGLTDPPGPGPRLQDLVTNDRLDVTVHEGFGFWVADAADDPATAAALEQANAAASPSARLTTVEAAYWTNVGTKEHLRWVMPEPEAELLDALARLPAAGRDKIADESRLVGMFRAHGLLVPVWDLPVGTGPEALEETAGRFAGHRISEDANPCDLDVVEGPAGDRDRSVDAGRVVGRRIEEARWCGGRSGRIGVERHLHRLWRGAGADREGDAAGLRQR